MRAAIVTLALVAGIGMLQMPPADHALAQGAMSSPSGQPGQAPVGHRQPRAQDVPTDTTPSSADDAIKRADEGTSKALNSICKGC